MASKTSLNAANLEALGAARLAQMLIDITAGDAVARRQLRLALAGASSPREAAREIGKRLSSLSKARSFIDRQGARKLAADLDAQRRAIVEEVAPQDPSAALALLWRLMALAAPVHQRCDDSNGAIGEVFAQATADLGQVAGTAGTDPEALATNVMQALLDNGFGQADGLIPALAPALGPVGITHLKALVSCRSTRTPPGRPA